ncbi:MAG: gamma carbonic anhydrase family protein [Methanomethylovorans sp.]|uniref:gamma carbonic anhydrase family protein n=1 Tax=Methanomethylovorans sp. TaxID=2758717 RepID=UPI003531781B
MQIGDNVSVGHGSMLHGCKIENNVIIGMNSAVLNGSEISNDSIVGANVLISEGKKFPEKSLIIGVPGRIKRELEQVEIESIAKNAAEYVELINDYSKINKK